MGELAGIPPFGGGGLNMRSIIEHSVPAIRPVEPVVDSRGLSGRCDTQTQADSGARLQSLMLARRALDRDRVPGPPPSFQISLLEMDRDLSETLARINAAHGLDRNVMAIAGGAEHVPPAPPEQADANAPDNGAAYAVKMSDQGQKFPGEPE